MFTSYWRKSLFMPMLSPEGGTGGTGDTGGNGDNENVEPNATIKEPSKTFTQDDLNRIAAQEKRQGISSVLKALGFEKEDDAKAFVEKYRKEENDKKDDLTKANENLANEKKAKEEAERKVDLIEKKFKVVAMGVSADKADDIVVLALTKAVNGKSFDDALGDLKKMYPALFEEDSSTGGTGGTGTGGNPPRGNKNGNPNAGGIGKRLAEQKKTTTQNKKSYFSN